MDNSNLYNMMEIARIAEDKQKQLENRRNKQDETKIVPILEETETES